MSARERPGSGPAAPGGAAGDPRRWRALAVLALVQFVFVLDLTVVNVALPRIQGELRFDPAGLAWVVNAYALTAGGLLLLGGRLGDLLGRRRVFLAGVALFAASSLVCGVAGTAGLLVAGRFGQGAGEALAAPAGLAMVALLFEDARERGTAIGIWAGLSAVGGTLGVVVSGVVNDLTTWRWIFLVNLPVAAFVLIAVPRLVTAAHVLAPAPPAPGRARAGPRADVAGALCVTAGMVALVYGLLRAAELPWGSAPVVVPLAAGLALLAAFAAVERRARHPLVPPAFFTDRVRMTGTAATLLFASAFFAMFFLLTLYMQKALGWSPLWTGLAYVPYGLMIVAGGGLATALLPRLGCGPPLAAGCAIGGAGLLLLSGMSPGGSYLADVLPGSLVVGFGAGLTFPMLGNACLHGVSEADAGLASGVQNAVYQAGGALGLAVLVTVAVRHAGGADDPAALTAGYAVALRAGAGAMLAAALLAAVLLRPYGGMERPGRGEPRRT
ncbi:MFS transporter [Bailinhaonella thermotolerans]|uniref:MFS transporter n=1 Tax=Bailinhaonella thermotolerans TaxID=1070861 RepID=A0A3A4AL54_9ACTN|nr:MFS transporter [Bailinhaonella thermotolerans]RJL27227.1 MFS transporter [Bailinhaonella thermotolerans]